MKFYHPSTYATISDLLIGTPGKDGRPIRREIRAEYGSIVVNLGFRYRRDLVAVRTLQLPHTNLPGTATSTYYTEKRAEHEGKGNGYFGPHKF